jgi:hypothetical protein
LFAVPVKTKSGNGNLFSRFPTSFTVESRQNFWRQTDAPIAVHDDAVTDGTFEGGLPIGGTEPFSTFFSAVCFSDENPTEKVSLVVPTSKSSKHF